MKTVGIFEAKTTLSRLLQEVEKGRDVMITRHGKPVAKLVRPERQFSSEESRQRREAIASLRELGRTLNLGLTHEEIKTAIEEGRR
ncbi:MAG: type II toxin-antitoxin system Phd/YefM family antitoxin [Pseudorhodoplanes sp.]|uniref:type II toxin-antitoxin system Phd/YefM family antitoxin n=1 Tax=Pseudorhodoplanes sp. TaxID=1934341 RepID=UPI003D0EB8F2